MDPLADFLTQIRNAYLARHSVVSTTYSRLKHNLAQLLSSTGFLSDIQVEGQLPHQKITATLRYIDNLPALTHISKVSTPSIRRYTKVTTIPRTLSGRGLTILSTSQGLMTDRQAKKAGLGGEIICRVW